MSLFIDLIGELLGCGHSVRFRANGRSMYPTIKDGEEIVVKPVALSAVRVGDVVLYGSQRRVIAHRVVRIARTEQRTLTPVLILRGDASDFPDAPIEVSRVLGKVVAVERDGRRVQLDARPAILVRGVRLCTARLRWTISRRLPRVAHLLRTCRDLFRVALKANA